MSAAAVVIIRRWDPTPVFHRLVRWDDGGHEVTQTVLDDGRTLVEHLTRLACGRVHDRWSWIEAPHPLGWQRGTDHKRSEAGIVVRHDHAERIGRPCSRCWP